MPGLAEPSCGGKGGAPHGKAARRHILHSSQRGSSAIRSLPGGQAHWAQYSRRGMLFYPLLFPYCLGVTVTLPVFSLGGGESESETTVALGWPTAVLTSTSTSSTNQPLASLPGLGSVPPKLVNRILAKEYIDIWELLPETWQLESENPCCHSKRPRCSLVTDISLWTECYATMAVILAADFPLKAPHFFTYLWIITKVSRNFEGAAWASYDVAFRRQAANHGSLDWGCVDPALYNEAFAGRAKLVPRRRYCLTDSHVSQECPHSPADLPNPSEGRQFRASARPQGLSQQADSLSGHMPPVQLPRRGRDAGSHYAAMPTRCRRPH